jgi:hypothetical protein
MFVSYEKLTIHFFKLHHNIRVNNLQKVTKRKKTTS